jgi:glutaminyl-peptide cyclotransferase
MWQLSTIWTVAVLGLSCVGVALVAKDSRPVPYTQIEDAAIHDSDCFTQGLLFHDGYMLESCGLYKRSRVRKVHPDTGTVVIETPLPNDIFAEGIAVVGDLLYMLTWTNKIVYLLDANTLVIRGIRSIKTFNGEGWGLTYDGEHLIASDGSDRLTLFHPLPDEVVSSSLHLSKKLARKTFLEHAGEIQVTDRITGLPYDHINELEYNPDDGFVYANIWYQNVIIRIDAKTGVADKLDFESLYPVKDRPRTADCLNGIAYNTSEKAFRITGKLWPLIYKVKLPQKLNVNSSEL